MGSFKSSSREETLAFGKRFGQILRKDSVVFLNGPLGAGKTTFVKGLALGMGVHDEITSPTFPTLQIYKGERETLFHFDLFRIKPEEFLASGWDEHLGEGVLCMEWGEKVANYLSCSPLRITFQKEGEEERLITWDGDAIE